MGFFAEKIQKLSEEDYVKKVYHQIILLGFLVHFLYIFMFRVLPLPLLSYFNIGSSIFYLFMLVAASKGWYRFAVTMIHLEISTFVVFSTLVAGWSLGFPLYLVAICSLLYFCPYEHRYVPYLFSVLEIIIFLCLKIYSDNHEPYYTFISHQVKSITYFYNSVACFGIILYTGFFSGVSARVTKQQLQKENDSLSQMANYDQLTGLMSRYSMKRQVDKYEGDRLLLAIGDIDDFKKVNDTYGHDCGDYVLQTVAELLSHHFMEGTRICRWGGEEFVFFITLMDKDNAVKKLKELCQLISKHRFEYGKLSFFITMTFGVAEGSRQEGFQDILKRADSCLYYGKKNGKDRVIG